MQIKPKHMPEGWSYEAVDFINRVIFKIFKIPNLLKKDDLTKTKRSPRHKWAATGKRSPMVQGFPLERPARTKNRRSFPPNGQGWQLFQEEVHEGDVLGWGGQWGGAEKRDAPTKGLSIKYIL